MNTQTWCKIALHYFQNLKRKRIVTYFVAGGHGTTACKLAWEQPNNSTKIESHLCIGVVDDGGHSGLLRLISEEINVDYIPLGDLRNIWADSIQNDVMSQLIQKRIGFNNNLNQLKDSLWLELKALISLVKIYCKNGNEIEKYLPENILEEYLEKYINGYESLLKKEDNLYNKHTIGNLFFSALMFSYKKIFNENPYSKICEIIQNIGIFPQNIFIHLIDNKRLDLLIQNKRGEVIEKGEGNIDTIEFPVKVEFYEAFDPKTNSKATKSKEIISLINNSDLIVIPPGSETNSYPWIKYYSQELKTKSIIRIVNLTVEQSSLGFIEEVGFLESLGLKPIYFYPKTFSNIKHELGEDQYFKLIAKYSLQNKRAQDLSTKTILTGVKLCRPEIFDNTTQEELKSRILSIVNVQAYFQNGTYLQEFGTLLEDDAYISQKGFRHSTSQIQEVIHKICTLSNITTESIIVALNENN